MIIILCLECPGTTFDEAFKSAQRVAIILQLTVEFNFNGVNVLVRSDSDLDGVSKRYMKDLRELSCRVSSGMGSCAKVHVAPAGWQLVPVEPTISMCIAGDGARVNVDDATRTPAIYRAMLAAVQKGGE